MELSARNHLPGIIKSIKLGGVMAEIEVDVKGLDVVAVITRGSAEAMNLAVGDEITVVIKSTEVMIAR